jgi:hypothetical protein
MEKFSELVVLLSHSLLHASKVLVRRRSSRVVISRGFAGGFSSAFPLTLCIVSFLLFLWVVTSGYTIMLSVL